MKSDLALVTAIVCLTIIFLVASYTMPEFSKLFLTIIIIIGGLAGFYVPQLIDRQRKIARGLKPIQIRHPIHIVAGILVALSAVVSLALPPTLAGLYVVYQIRQSKWEHDKAYLDILDCLVPAFATAGVLITLHFLEVI